ncbi:DUF7601 domain-containing protein [Faecalimonas sp.]
MKKSLKIKYLIVFFLIFSVLISNLFSVSIYAENDIFIGVEDTTIEENTMFDLLKGVVAQDQSGIKLNVSVSNVRCENDPTFLYDNSNLLNVGRAGLKYIVEYIAYPSEESTEKYSITRKVTSIRNMESDKDSGDKEEGSEKNELYGENQSPIKEGLQIIHKNGMHYIMDPQYLDKEMLLYCMNNKLKWPHTGQETPRVPDYEDGYLTPHMFETVEKYNECMQKLKKLLFAGYPYNGERFYKIIKEAELHTPTVDEFNAMLILPPQLKRDFPYLAQYQFSLDALNNKTHYDALVRFMGEVRALYPNNVTPHGLTHADITIMPFYKAANSMTFGGYNIAEEEVRKAFANLYSNSYFVTEQQAYDATQDAIWKLLKDYGVPDNDMQELSHSQLAQVLWQYCKHGGLLEREPKSEEIKVEGDLKFTYHHEDGMWHSGKLKINEPAEYNGLYNLILPEGVTTSGDEGTYVYGNQEYELVSKRKPDATGQFRIEAGIDWLQDMKQYSPIGDDRFQHMIGAVVRKTQISKTISYTSEAEGILEISKSVVGDEEDLQKEFSFVLELPENRINGNYGDFHFNDGVASFTLRAGETKRAEHLPAGAKYSVKENKNDKYFVTSTNSEGHILDNETVTVSFLNERKIELALSKLVTGNMGDKTKEFTFNISLMKKDGSPFEGDVNYTASVVTGYEVEAAPVEDGVLKFSGGKATIKLSHGQRITIHDLPFQCKYSVQEQEENQDHYTTTYNDQTDSPNDILNKNVEICVKNHKETIPETGIQTTSKQIWGLLIGILLIGSCILYLCKRVRK